MADKSGGLASRTGASFRRGVGVQAKAWSQYGSLLGQVADSKIGVVDFGRRAIDVYIDAVGHVLSVGTEIAGDAVKTGLDRFAGSRSKAEAMIDAAEHAARTADRPKRAKPAPRTVRTPKTAITTS